MCVSQVLACVSLQEPAEVSREDWGHQAGSSPQVRSRRVVDGDPGCAKLVEMLSCCAVIGIWS